MPLDEEEKNQSKSPGRNDKDKDEPKKNIPYKGFRKDERGRVKAGQEFNDKELIGEERARIVGLKVWKGNGKITGVKAFYKIGKGLLEGDTHLIDNSSFTFEEYNFEEQGDYVKEISGFIDRSGGAIECLIVTSFKGDTKKVGEPTKNSKLFKFDINEMEYPACLYGTLKETENGSVLSRLGVLIAVDEPVEEQIDALVGDNTKDDDDTLERADSDGEIEPKKEGSR
mmetsp:Transcript_33323/g.30278  ORF Transcript_33323/g.30278 Transcript_33323/m.30278 type:complete len:227 (+) Transcript_33323:505-1185(+)